MLVEYCYSLLKMNEKEHTRVCIRYWYHANILPCLRSMKSSTSQILLSLPLPCSIINLSFPIFLHFFSYWKWGLLFRSFFWLLRFLQPGAFQRYWNYTILWPTWCTLLESTRVRTAVIAIGCLPYILVSSWHISCLSWTNYTFCSPNAFFIQKGKLGVKKQVISSGT